MRFADRLLRPCLAIAACAALSACSSFPGLSGPLFGGGQEDAAQSQQKPAEAAVSPEVQRAFDDARRALKAGRAVEAERGFLALTRSNPELGGPHANLGVIYRQAGKLAEAVAELDKAVRLSPQQPIYFNELGIAHRLRGEFDKARDAYDQALALDPNFAGAHLNLGILYDIYLWDSTRALEHYDRYMALSPGGDDKVKKWIADIKNRSGKQSMVTQKEKK
jgi:Flp pilus assembly protein TadD